MGEYNGRWYLMSLDVSRIELKIERIKICFFCLAGGVATRGHTDNSYYSNARYYEEPSDRRDT